MYTLELYNTITGEIITTEKVEKVIDMVKKYDLASKEKRHLKLREKTK